jgi:glucose/arabinose dehydrogenase
MFRLIQRLIFFCAGSVMLIALPLAAAAPADLATGEVDVEGERFTVKIPAGYRLEFLTGAMKRPRFITFAANGELLAGSRSGKVYRLAPPYTQAKVLAKFSDYPHSVVVRGNALYVAETAGLYRARYRPGITRLRRKDFTLVTPLPDGGSHSSRTVGVGPDNRLYIGVGISGNCPNEYLDDSYDFENRRGGVFVVDESGDKPRLRPYASGLRNPIGFAWHPDTEVLYANNNGPDHWGYELPREYFGRLSEGSFHGMPWYQYVDGRFQRDTCIRAKPPRPVTEAVPPEITFDARNAPMGMVFVSKGALGPRLEGNAIVAMHGSWGTQPRGGYAGDPATRRHPKLVQVMFEDGRATQVVDLITGFQLANGRRWARPCGVAIGPDGALYFTSDGGTNGLFRLRRTN